MQEGDRPECIPGLGAYQKETSGWYALSSRGWVGDLGRGASYILQYSQAVSNLFYFRIVDSLFHRYRPCHLLSSSSATNMLLGRLVFLFVFIVVPVMSLMHTFSFVE